MLLPYKKRKTKPYRITTDQHVFCGNNSWRLRLFSYFFYTNYILVCPCYMVSLPLPPTSAGGRVEWGGAFHFAVLLFLTCRYYSSSHTDSLVRSSRTVVCSSFVLLLYSSSSCCCSLCCCCCFRYRCYSYCCHVFQFLQSYSYLANTKGSEEWL